MVDYTTNTGILKRAIFKFTKKRKGEPSMEKKERRVVFAVDLVLLLIFTFTDLQISMAIANKPA